MKKTEETMKMITEETIKEWGEKNPEFKDYINNNLPEKDISELLAMKPSYESYYRIKNPLLILIVLDEWKEYFPIWDKEILQKELAKKKKLAKRGHSNEFIQIFIDYLSKKLEYQEEIKVQEMSMHRIQGIRNKYGKLQTFYNEVIEPIAYELDRILFADSAGVIPFLKKNNICKEFRDILDIHRTYTKERLNIDKKKVQLDTWKLIQKRIGDATKIMNTKRMEKLASQIDEIYATKLRKLPTPDKRFLVRVECFEQLLRDSLVDKETNEKVDYLIRFLKHHSIVNSV